MKGTDYYRLLVAVETDATRYYGANATRPALLGQADSEQMLAHLAADLKDLLPYVSQCSLIAAGALFDQTQILRPGFPVFSALESTSTAKLASEFRPCMVSLAATDGRMPLADLQPLDKIPLGLLQLLPVVLHGPADIVAELGQAMEYRFLEEGQLSAHSALWLGSAFGVSINHGRFMTLTDLNAMLRLQLDHYGFLPLWELLDAALNERSEDLSIQTTSGLVLEWRDQVVSTQFETFDHWANDGGGSEREGARQGLAVGYSDWTREVRQYLTTLKAHGVKLVFHPPSTGEQPLSGSYFIEPSMDNPARQAAAVTEHSYADMGTIAVSLVNDGKLVNYYPLSPEGLNEIQREIRKHVPQGHTVAFPGTILYDGSSRRLRADSHAEPRAKDSE
jgi:hypothetical protein